MTTDTVKYSIVESHHHRESVINFTDIGIVYIKLKDNIQIELEDSKKQFQLLKSKYDGINKYLILVEIGNDCSISKDAREFGERPESNEMTKAVAVIVKSLAHRIIVNFIIKFTNHQPMKMKIFDDKQKAMDWLLTFK